MSRSAQSTRFRPASASDRSLTSPRAGAAVTVANASTPLGKSGNDARSRPATCLPISCAAVTFWYNACEHDRSRPRRPIPVQTDHTATGGPSIRPLTNPWARANEASCDAPSPSNRAARAPARDCGTACKQARQHQPVGTGLGRCHGGASGHQRLELGPVGFRHRHSQYLADPFLRQQRDARDAAPAPARGSAAGPARSRSMRATRSFATTLPNRLRPPTTTYPSTHVRVCQGEICRRYSQPTSGFSPSDHADICRTQVLTSRRGGR